jgi:hypothetical protein
MSREEVHKLLGGYATGTLTPEEQEVLFAAALEDQEIFDALAREQGLRDLLRDPAARGHLLAALNERPDRGFWGWLQPPVIAGLAMAGIAVLAVVAWQATRPGPPAPLEMAQVRPGPSEALPPAAPAPSPMPDTNRPVPPTRPEPGERQAAPRSASRPAHVADADQARLRREPAPSAAPAATPQAAAPETALKKEKDQAAADANLIAPAQPARAAPPAVVPPQSAQARNQQIQTAPAPQGQQGQLEQVQEASKANLEMAKSPVTARDLFYANLAAVGGFAAGRAGFMPSAAGGGGGGAPSRAASTVRAPAGNKTDSAAAAAVDALDQLLANAPAHLGVRCTVLRAGREADLTTPLNAGETVRLRVTPNADGYLSVYEGDRLLSSGPARRMQAFDTAEIKSDTAGQKQLRVVLTRTQAPAAVTGALAKQTRANLVEPAAGQDPGTYAVARDGAPLPTDFSLPVTLSWK